MTHLSPKKLRSLCREVYYHDWSQDPYAGGAYSYVGVTSTPLYDFSKPFEKGIWITGEVAAEGSNRGTVHGAMKAATACAKAVQKALQR